MSLFEFTTESTIKLNDHCVCMSIVFERYLPTDAVAHDKHTAMYVVYLILSQSVSQSAAI